MITFQQLRDVRPEQWLDAGDEWVAMAKKAQTASDDLRQGAHLALNSGIWVSPAARAAQATVDSSMSAFGVAYLECWAVGHVCRGLGHALRIAQDGLTAAVDRARGYGLLVDDTGTVRTPAGPELRHDSDVQPLREEVTKLISAALTAAGQADDKAAPMLNRLAEAVGHTKEQDAEEDQLAASHLEVRMIAGTVPGSGDRQLATDWWNALSPSDRQALTLAAPVALAQAGIRVRDSLRRTGPDPVAMVKWATDHATDDRDNAFDDNCANFVSDALEAGGAAPTLDWHRTRGDIAAFEPGAHTRWNLATTDSWSGANASYEYWKSHGTVITDVSQAQPGDLIYWEQAKEAHPGAPLHEMHHAGVVTAVVDGDVRYTAHTDDKLNESVTSWEPIDQRREGEQKLHVIRPTAMPSGPPWPAGSASVELGGPAYVYPLPAPDRGAP
jgi:hypothetical protein